MDDEKASAIIFLQEGVISFYQPVRPVRQWRPMSPPASGVLFIRFFYHMYRRIIIDPSCDKAPDGSGEAPLTADIPMILAVRQ